jgi:hypothetical protein
MDQEMSTVGARSALILFPLAGWLLWASLAFSYLSDAASDACESEAFWTSGWFFPHRCSHCRDSSRGDLWPQVDLRVGHVDRGLGDHAYALAHHCHRMWGRLATPTVIPR